MSRKSLKQLLASYCPDQNCKVEIDYENEAVIGTPLVELWKLYMKRVCVTWRFKIGGKDVAYRAIFNHDTDFYSAIALLDLSEHAAAMRKQWDSGVAPF